MEPEITVANEGIDLVECTGEVATGELGHAKYHVRACAITTPRGDECDD